MIGIILLDAIVEMSISEVVVGMIFFKVWEEKLKKPLFFLTLIYIYALGELSSLVYVLILN